MCELKSKLSYTKFLPITYWEDLAPKPMTQSPHFSGMNTSQTQ